LYHPRRDRWAEHFAWSGTAIVGQTPIGRVTVAILAMNHPAQLVASQSLMDAGLFPFPS
jgi:hypothetical protein